MQGAVNKFLSGGQQKDGQAFTASERHEVSGIRCRGSSQKGIDILAERNSDAVPPMPMARTVLDTVQ